MSTVKTHKQPCPYCGTAVDAMTNLDENTAGPKPGDVSICLYCGGYLRILDRGGAFRPLTDDEFAGIEPDVRRRMAKVRAAVTVMQEMREQGLMNHKLMSNKTGQLNSSTPQPVTPEEHRTDG